MSLTTAHPLLESAGRSLKSTGFRTCTGRLSRRSHISKHSCTEADVRRMFISPVTENLAWENPCGASSSTENKSFQGNTSFTHIKRVLKETLQAEFGSCTRRGTSWCNDAKKYTFFERRRTRKICLRLEHKRLQVYVAAFHFLSIDANQTHKLNEIAINAKRLLCEVETAINQTGISFPGTIRGAEMCHRLQLQSMESPGDDQIDIIFAKANFGKYLRGFNQTITENRRSKNCSKCSGSSEYNSSNRSNVSNSSVKRRKNPNSKSRELHHSGSLGNTSNRGNNKNSGSKRHNRSHQHKNHR